MDIVAFFQGTIVFVLVLSVIILPMAYRQANQSAGIPKLAV